MHLARRRRARRFPTAARRRARPFNIAASVPVGKVPIGTYQSSLELSACIGFSVQLALHIVPGLTVLGAVRKEGASRAHFEDLVIPLSR